MFSLDVDLGIEMWLEILNNNKEFLLTKDSAIITSVLLYTIFRILGWGNIADKIVNNKKLRKILFSQSYSIRTQVNYIFECVVHNKTKLADQLIELLYNNPYKEYSWYKTLDEIIPPPIIDSVNTETFDMLEKWCDTVTDKQERAKLSLKMIALMK